MYGSVEQAFVGRKEANDIWAALLYLLGILVNMLISPMNQTEVKSLWYDIIDFLFYRECEYLNTFYASPLHKMISQS